MSDNYWDLEPSARRALTGAEVRALLPKIPDIPTCTLYGNNTGIYYKEQHHVPESPAYILVDGIPVCCDQYPERIFVNVLKKTLNEIVRIASDYAKLLGS